MKSLPGGARKPTLLFVDYEVPQYDLYAGSRTNFMYLEMLVEMGLEVKFLPEDFRRVEPYSTELNQLGIETLDGEWFRDNWENWLQQNGAGIDYVFFHKPDPATRFLPAVRQYTRAATIYQCHDLHYLRLRRKAHVENDEAILEEAERYEIKEDFIFSNCDVLLTFSEVEERSIREKFPGKQVFTVPLFFYWDVPERERDFTRRHDLLYVGSCSHTPNRDAISWFCRKVFPLVQEKLPDIAINVVGAHPTQDILELDSDSIRILGRVSEEKLEKLYETTRLMVVPLRFGAGVKGKVIESLYNGLPLVSTSIGLEGINGIDQLATPRDKARDFAEEIVNLYSDINHLYDLSLRGSRFVSDHFTARKTAELMAGILSVSKDVSARRLSEESPEPQLQKPPRLIAFYLPQFHPIPENDKWWGKGFTEWTNVTRAEPIFPGHYQPHVPADLGYYDLRDEQVRVAQAELAKQYGIEGFCYYHYWFNGHRLLERPLEDMLKTGTPDFPFCICWANENWTRRWDGKDKKILMQQTYSDEDDRQHIRSLIPVFKDRRYIRVNGKPLFLVYRTENMPDPARTADIWREEVRKAGLGELHLCRVESISISNCDPGDIHFDTATEFAPDWWAKGPELRADSELIGQTDKKTIEVCKKNFIHSYKGLSDTMMAKDAPSYTWFRCVTPSWDNWARMQKGCSVFLGSTPEKYRLWLSRVIDDTNERLLGDERIVFINAWNEWAEGNHLEPDEKFGRGYLEATRQAIEETRVAPDSRHAGRSDNIRMGQLMSQLVDNRYRLNELQTRVEEQQQMIEELLNSTSWKVTVPLRWVRQGLRAIRMRILG